MMSLFQKIQKIAVFSVIFISVASAMEAPDTIKILVRLNYQQEQEPVTAREEKKSGSYIGRASARLGSGIRSLRTLGSVQRIEIEGGKNRRLGPILSEALEKHGCATFHIANPEIKQTMTMEKVYRNLHGDSLVVNCGESPIEIKAKINLVTESKRTLGGEISIKGAKNQKLGNAIENTINNLGIVCKKFTIEHPLIQNEMALSDVRELLIHSGDSLIINCGPSFAESPSKPKSERVNIGIKIDYVSGSRVAQPIPTLEQQRTADLIISGSPNESYSKAFKRAIRGMSEYRDCEFVVDIFGIEPETKLGTVEQRLKGELLNVMCFPKKEELERQTLEQELHEDIKWETTTPPLEIRIVENDKITKIIEATVDDTRLQKILKENRVCKDINTIKIQVNNKMKRYNVKDILKKSIEEIRASLMTTGDNVLEVHCK